MTRTRSIGPLLDELRNRPETAAHYGDAVAESIGESLRDARAHAGLNQDSVAARLGVTRSRVAQMENGDGVSLTLRSLYRYARAVNCRVDIALVDRKSGALVTRIFGIDDGVRFEVTAARAPSHAGTDVQPEIRWADMDELQEAVAYRESSNASAS